MDFHAMKRKRLQSMCKKHGIPANLKNKEMADRLSLIFKGKENDGSCQSGPDIAGTDKGNFQCFSGEGLLNEESGELKSNNGNNDQLVASGTVAGDVDAREEKFLSSGKRSPSPNLEERIGFSPKLLENSEIERLESKINLSPKKTRHDIEVCAVEDNMQSGVNKEQVDGIHEGLHSAPGAVVMKDVDLVQVATEEFGTAAGNADACEAKFVSPPKISLSPGSDKIIRFSPSPLNDLENKGLEFETILPPETPKDDIEVFDVEENMQSDVNKDHLDVSQEVLHAAPSAVVINNVGVLQSEEFDNHLVQGEFEKLADKTDLSEDVSGTGKGEIEAEKQNETNSPQGSNIKNLSPILVSPDEYGYLLVEGEAHESVDSICVHGDAYSIVNKEQVDDSREALLTSPSSVVMSNADFVQVASEEFGNHLVEGELEKLGDKTDAQEDIYGTRKGGAEAEKQDVTNSPQGPDINDVDLPQVSPEESGDPLVDGEVQKSDETIRVHGGVYSFQNSGSEVDTMCYVDTSTAAKDADRETNVTTDHFPHEVQSSSFKYSDGILDQFTTTYPLSEAKSSDLDIHQLVVSGTAAGNVDECEAKIVSSSKISISSCSEKIVGFSPDLLNDLKAKGLEFEASLHPETLKDDIESFDVEANMQTGYNEGLEFEMNLPPATPTDDIESFDVEENMQTVDNKGLEFETNFPPATPKDDIEICDVEENMQSGVNKDHVLRRKEASHAAPSAVVMNHVDRVQVASDEFGNHLVEREFEKLIDKNDLSEDVCGTEKGGAEAEKQDNANSPQGSNINDENQEEPGYALVEGEFQKSDDTIYAHGSVYNFRNYETEVDLMCLLDASINAKDSDGKANVTAEHFPDQVHSSNVEYLDGIPEQFLATYPPSEVKCSDFNIHEMVVSDTIEEKLESSQKKGLVADPEECIGFYSEHLEASEIKDFEAEIFFDPSTLGDIVETCNMNESMQSVKTDTVTGDEDICQEKLGSSPKCTPVASSKKRKNSFPKLLESSMMEKELKNERNSTLKTARDILGTCDMKENIKTAKKEQFGSTISKKTFPRRQPLQDLQQK